jgi:hypothetical protein
MSEQQTQTLVVVLALGLIGFGIYLAMKPRKSRDLTVDDALGIAERYGLL